MGTGILTDILCSSEFSHLCVNGLTGFAMSIEIQLGIERVHSLTFRIRTMLSYCEVEASWLVGWSLTSLFSTNAAMSETKASL